MTALFFLTAATSPTELQKLSKLGAQCSKELRVLVAKVNFKELLSSQPQQHLTCSVRHSRAA